MQRVSGTVKIHGSIGYAPQQAWIINDTLRANILFGLPYDKEWYEKVIKACALLPDLDALPAGDLTEIGDRGVNLSGGQKQRVNLARAVYHDCEIYLLDDVLSAVDVHVKQYLFDEVIGPHGLLRSKTRIWITNVHSFLPACDDILIMKNGQIIYFGSYKGIDKTALPLVIENREFLESKEKRESRESNNSQEGLEERPDAGKLSIPEVPEIGKVTWGTYVLYFKSGGMAVLPLIVFTILAYACDAFAFIWLGKWMARDTVTLDIAMKGINILGLTAAMQVIFTISLSTCATIFSIGASRKLHQKLLISILQSPISFFDQTPAGRILNRCDMDINAVDARIWIAMLMAVCAIPASIMSVIPALVATPMIVFLIIPAIIAVITLQRFYITSARQFLRLEAVSKSPVYSRLHDILQSPANVRIYKKQIDFCERFDHVHDINAKCQMVVSTCFKWLSLNIDFICTILITSSALFVILSPNMTIGIAGMSLTAIIGVSDLLNYGITRLCDFELALVSIERIKEYLNLKQEALLFENDSSNVVSKPWPTSGRIEFIDYCLRYRPELPLALKHMKFLIEDKEKIGIIGRTGAGKSSLTLALFRLIEPTSGSILIDSVDISTINLQHLRSQITIIPQDPVLFCGTLRQNLDPFEQHSDDELWTALEESHLKKFVQTLPAGLLSNLEDGGSNMSVGQRQLICLARALLRKSRILILDEATASMDMETEQLIRKTILGQFSQCTVIFIAHRLESIMDCDSVALLEQGELVEHGPVKELLLDQNSKFRDMVMRGG